MQYAPTGSATLLQRQNFLGGEVGKIGEEKYEAKTSSPKIGEENMKQKKRKGEGVIG